MSASKKVRARPGPPPHKDGRYVIVALNVREKMRDEIEAAATSDGLSISGWVREVVERSLRRRR